MRFREKRKVGVNWMSKTEFQITWSVNRLRSPYRVPRHLTIFFEVFQDFLHNNSWRTSGNRFTTRWTLCMHNEVFTTKFGLIRCSSIAIMIRFGDSNSLFAPLELLSNFFTVFQLRRGLPQLIFRLSISN